jgi:hypothetical protein
MFRRSRHYETQSGRLVGSTEDLKFIMNLTFDSLTCLDIARSDQIRTTHKESGSIVQSYTLFDA